jgi:alpha-galactosidase
MILRLLCLCVLFVSGSLRAADKPIKVFVLAGQSNMEGHAKMSLLEYQAAQPATAPLFAHFRRDGHWVERDDVFIKFLERHGKLTVNYGSPQCIGPELQFGWSVGDHYEEPVLLIKPAWGGRSLYRDFRPPSAGLPPDTALQKPLTNAQKKKSETTLDDIKKTFGATYRDMLTEVQTGLGDLKTYVPGYAGQGYELAGFIWFQGWNDMIDRDATAEYAANLAHFIRDVRRDLKSPQLPFVIVQMGVDGANPSKNVQTFKAAQAEVAARPEFQGNVAMVKADALWDLEADAVFRKGWKEHKEEWDRVGSDYPYHYLGSARTLCAIGRACAEAVLKLRKE